MGLSAVFSWLRRFGGRTQSSVGSLTPLHDSSFAAEVMRNIDTAIAIFDADCRYLYVNPVAVKDEARRRSLIGKTDVEYATHWGNNIAIAENRLHWMKQALAENRAVDFEEELLDSDGDSHYFVRKMRPVPTPDGRPHRMIGYGFDITDIKRAQEALRASEEQLLQAQKMEAIGLLAGGIAHDFNNLLTVIGLHTELLAGAESARQGDRTEDLREICKAVERAQSLTNQLLAFGRKQILQPRLLNLNAVVADTETMMRRLLPERISLTADLSPDLRLVKVDPGQIAQVILNLAVNARDAMPDGGTLNISTRNAKMSPEMIDEQCVEGEYVVLSVADTGEGMDDSTRRRLFEPFFTTKGNLHGTGLGLAMVYGIVRQSGGCISVDTAPGRGSKFQIYFPVRAGIPEWPDSNETQDPTTAPRSGVVLLVEDEDAVRAVARKVLERSGFSVIEAGNGVDALEAYRRLGAPVDLLLTDLVMPQMGGIELAKAMSRLQPGIKIVFMSGYTDEGDRLRERITLPGTAFLAKPFSVSGLQGKVTEVLA